MQSVSNILENGVFNVFIKNENRHELEALAGTIGIQNGPLILCYGPTKVFPRTELTQYQSSSTKRLTESDQELLNEIFHLEDDNTNWPQEFAQVFQDLQALPMGKAMIRRILGIHRQCPSLPKVYFCNKDSEGPQIVWPGYTNTSAKNVLCNSSLITNMVNLPHAEINLTWDSTKKEFLWNEYIMPIQEVTRKLGFVTCKKCHRFFY